MKAGTLLKGIRRKLGTESTERYTQEIVLGTMEEVINSDILTSNELDCFIAPEKKLEVVDGVADLPEDFFGMVLDIENGGAEKVEVNAIDEWSEAGQKAWTMRRDFAENDDKQRIFLNWDCEEIVLRYISFFTIDSPESNIALPFVFKKAIEALTAGRVLLDDQQEYGQVVWNEGMKALEKAFAFEMKQQVGQGGFAMKSVYDNDKFVL